MMLSKVHTSLLTETSVNSNLIVAIRAGVVSIFGTTNAKWNTTKWPKQTAEKTQQEDHQYNEKSQ